MLQSVSIIGQFGILFDVAPVVVQTCQDGNSETEVAKKKKKSVVKIRLSVLPVHGVNVVFQAPDASQK